MNVFNLTNCFVSKGFEDNPAIRYNTGENGSSSFFRIGEKVYDKRAENNHRWNNWNVKAFGALADRIQKMKLDAGSSINISGRLDMDTWTDDAGNKRSAPVIILSDVEFTIGSNKKETGNGNGDGDSEKRDTGGQDQFSQQTQSPPPERAEPSQPAEEPDKADGFTGFEGFASGSNPFFPEE